MKIQLIHIDKIKPYRLNQKIHPENQIFALSEMIREFKFLKPILLDEKNIILAGHGAYEAGIMAGYTKIPCIIHSHLSKRQKEAFRIADNKIAEKSIWDFDKLAVSVSGLSEADFNLDLLGMDEQELENILSKSSKVLNDLDKQNKKEILVKSHERKIANSKPGVHPVSMIGDKFTLGGLDLEIFDSDAIANADWLIRRWQARTGEDAVHEEGMTFNNLSNARKKG